MEARLSEVLSGVRFADEALIDMDQEPARKFDARIIDAKIGR
jgi:hypothetical protein